MVVDKFGRDRATTKRKFGSGDVDELYHDLENKRLARVGTPENDDDAVTKNYLDTALQSLTTADIAPIKTELIKIGSFFDYDNRRIIRLTEPTAGYHAATKTYVDNKDKTTKEQIRAECEKVKREALAEGDKKRDTIRTELLTAIESIRQEVRNVQRNRRIDNLFVDALYKHLNIQKSSVTIPLKTNHDEEQK